MLPGQLFRIKTVVGVVVTVWFGFFGVQAQLLPGDADGGGGGRSGGGGGAGQSAQPLLPTNTITVQPNSGVISITIPAPRPTNIMVPPSLPDELPPPSDSPITGSPNFPSENNAGRRRITLTVRPSQPTPGLDGEEGDEVGPSGNATAPVKKKKSTKNSDDSGLGTAAIIGIVLGVVGLLLFVVAAVARWSRKGRDRRYREPSFTELDFSNNDEANPFRPVHEADPFKRHLYHTPQQGPMAPASAYQPYK